MGYAMVGPRPSSRPRRAPQGTGTRGHGGVIPIHQFNESGPVCCGDDGSADLVVFGRLALNLASTTTLHIGAK